MSTPLYSTDIIPMTSRPTLTVMDDGDYFVILDTSTGKISKILKTLAMEALKISYDNTTSGLTAETVQAALDELVVNLGSGERLRTQIASLNGQWITPTLVNGWKNYNSASYQTCQYFKDVNGIVHLKGFIDAGTINAEIFILPAGYRPSRIAYFAGVSINVIASIAVNFNGGVTVVTGSPDWVSLDGITFKAEV